MGKNLGFISTHFTGTDSAVLESKKWAEIFEDYRYSCFWFAGELNRNSPKNFMIPEAHFQHSKNRWINERIFLKRGRKPSVTDTIHELRSKLKTHLHDFLNRFDIDYIIVANLFSLPFHVPFALALTETIAETQIPTISLHNDFYWDRINFSVNAISDYLHTAFPPNLPEIQYVVNNNESMELLKNYKRISAIVVPSFLNNEMEERAKSPSFPAVQQSQLIDFRQDSYLKSGAIHQNNGENPANKLIETLRKASRKMHSDHDNMSTNLMAQL